MQFFFYFWKWENWGENIIIYSKSYLELINKGVRIWTCIHRILWEANTKVRLDIHEIYWEKHLRRIKRKKQEGWSGKGFRPRCRCDICKGEKEVRVGEEEPQTVQIWESLGQTERQGVSESQLEEPLIMHEEPSASTCMLLGHWLRESKRSVVCHKCCGESTAAIGDYAPTVVSLEGRPAGYTTKLQLNGMSLCPYSFVCCPS